MAIPIRKFIKNKNLWFLLESQFPRGTELGVRLSTSESGQGQEGYVATYYLYKRKGKNSQFEKDERFKIIEKQQKNNPLSYQIDGTFSF